VLSAISSLSRVDFVPEELGEVATLDRPLPIGFGQTISQPFVVAYMTQALRLHGGERVLEIGTGSGYQTAVLARLGCEVFSIEIVPELAALAAERLGRLGFRHVHLREGNGWLGWQEEAPFDAILLTAAPLTFPVSLVGQLAPRGRMIAPLGEVGRPQRLMMLRRSAEGGLAREHLIDVQFVPMTGREPTFA
jgi:protein-L-isoaspartate(D-aspartate) O-methyltransferase